MRSPSSEENQSTHRVRRAGKDGIPAERVLLPFGDEPLLPETQEEQRPPAAEVPSSQVRNGTGLLAGSVAQEDTDIVEHDPAAEEVAFEEAIAAGPTAAPEEPHSRIEHKPSTEEMPATSDPEDATGGAAQVEEAVISSECEDDELPIIQIVPDMPVAASEAPAPVAGGVIEVVFNKPVEQESSVPGACPKSEDAPVRAPSAVPITLIAAPVGETIAAGVVKGAPRFRLPLVFDPEDAGTPDPGLAGGEAAATVPAAATSLTDKLEIGLSQKLELPQIPKSEGIPETEDGARKWIAQIARHPRHWNAVLTALTPRFDRSAYEQSFLEMYKKSGNMDPASIVYRFFRRPEAPANSVRFPLRIEISNGLICLGLLLASVIALIVSTTHQ